MSRFYFNVRMADDLYDDPEGSELEHMSAARDHAIRIARGILSGEVLDGNLDLGSSVEVRDGAQRLLISVSFKDAIRIRDQHHDQVMPISRKLGGGRSPQGAYLRLVMPHG